MQWPRAVLCHGNEIGERALAGPIKPNSHQRRARRAFARLLGVATITLFAAACGPAREVGSGATGASATIEPHLVAAGVANVPTETSTTATPAPTTTVQATTTTTTTTSTAPTTTRRAIAVEHPPSDERTLRLVDTIGGNIAPKSVVASGRGLVFAQNMMYRHTITVYDETGALRKTIPDTVSGAQLGRQGDFSAIRGAPVEAAFSPDGRYAYVSNYSMFGTGYANPGDDVCRPGQFDDSFVYRIDTTTLTIDQVIAVGSVPKYVAVTSDNRLLLVSNWCSYDLSVIDIASAREIARLPLGAYPRGIAVTTDAHTAFVAVMGSRDVAAVDLHTFDIGWIRGVGDSPRHLVLDPNGAFLYVTLNGAGEVAKVNLFLGKVVATAATGAAPRSMTIAPDGLSLYVVNYESNTMSKIRTSDFAILQTVPTKPFPIGITYVPATNQVWVSCYSGSIMMFADE